MRKTQCLLFVLKRSYICYFIICLTEPWKLFLNFINSTIYSSTMEHPNKRTVTKNWDVLKAAMRIRRVVFVNVIGHSSKSVVLYTCFLKSVFTWKSKLNLPSRLALSNLTFSSFKISVSEIMYIYGCFRAC